MKAEADRADQAGAEDAGRNSLVAAACAEADIVTRTRTKAGVATTSLIEAVGERGNLMTSSTWRMATASPPAIIALTLARHRADPTAPLQFSLMRAVGVALAALCAAHREPRSVGAVEPKRGQCSAARLVGPEFGNWNSIRIQLSHSSRSFSGNRRLGA
jgi:hypothetical protein